MSRLEKEGAITNFEAQLLRNDSTPLWASISVKAVKDDDGAILHLDGIVEDISERKKVEQALIASEAKYRILAETAQDIILMLIYSYDKNSYSSNHCFFMLTHL